MAHQLEQTSLISNSDALALPADFDRLVRALDSQDWRAVLALSQSIKSRLLIAEKECARTAQANGVTWEEIGAAVGMTKQAAHKKWGDSPALKHNSPRKRK